MKLFKMYIIVFLLAAHIYAADDSAEWGEPGIYRIKQNSKITYTKIQPKGLKIVAKYDDLLKKYSAYEVTLYRGEEVEDRLKNPEKIYHNLEQEFINSQDPLEIEHDIKQPDEFM